MRIHILVALLATACAGAQRPQGAAQPSAAQRDRRVVRGDGFHVVGATETREGDAYDAALLFDRAVTAMRAERCDDALRDLDTLVREFSATRYVFAAHFNRGLCHQRARRWGEAEQALRVAATDPTDQTVARDALFRLAVVGEGAQRPELVLEATERLLARPRLELREQVESHARRAVALLAMGRLDEATESGQHAIRLAPSREAISALGDDAHAAMARVAVAEVVRARASAITIRVEGDEGGAGPIRERTRLVMRGHSLFNDALRVGNPEWQAVAGFRIGEMYRDLYRAIVDAPLPREWGEPARAIFRRRAAEQLRPLLSSALTIWELTQSMARRESIQTNEWVRRTSESIEELRSFVTGAPSQNSGTPRAPRAPRAAPPVVRPAG